MLRNKFATYSFLGFILLLNLLTAVLLIVSLQSDIRGVESNVIYTIQYALKTGLIYMNPEVLPYAITQYSPLFYVICIKLASTLGLEPGEDVHKIYMLSRFVSFMASVGVSILAYIIAARHLQLGKMTGLLIAITAFLIPVPWFFLARPDALASLFLFASLEAFLAYLTLSKQGNKRQFFWLVVSAFVAVLALFSKQNGIVVLGIPGLFLLLHKHWKAVFIYGAFVLLFLALGYAAILSKYPLEILHANLVKGVDNGIDPLAFFKKVLFVYLSEFILLVSFTAVLLYLVFKQRDLIKQAPIQVKFIGFFFLAVTAFAFLSAIKVGSAHNYLIDSLLLSLFLIGYAWQNLPAFQEAALNPVVRLFAVIGFAIFALNFSLENFYVYAGEGSLKTYYNRKKGYDAEVKLAENLENELRKQPGTYILSLNRDVNNHLFEYVAFPQSEIANIPHQWKVYDYTNFVKDMGKGKIKLVLWPEEKVATEFAGKKLTGYQLYKKDTLDHNLYMWQGVK